MTNVGSTGGLVQITSRQRGIINQAKVNIKRKPGRGPDSRNKVMITKAWFEERWVPWA